MAKLTVGQLMPDFSFQTLFQGHLSFYDAVKGKKTVLVFHRFIGCRISQFDIRKLAKDYAQITAAGGQAFVVVQSPVETVRGYYNEDSLPYTIICDPKLTLYKQFDIQPAKSAEELNSGNTEAKMAEIRKTNLVKGDPEGELLQLPAVFVVDESLKVTYAYYGKNAADTPSVAEIAEILKHTN